MLSHHAGRRDAYGLPILKGVSGSETWKAEHEQLHKHIEEARIPIANLAWIQRWIMARLDMPLYIPTTNEILSPINSNIDKSVDSEIGWLIQIRQDAEKKWGELANASVTFLRNAVCHIPDRFSPHNSQFDYLVSGPQGFLRVWGPKSATKYDEAIGFRCSSWKFCRPETNLDKVKQKHGGHPIKKVKSYHENESISSDWIPLAGEITWMLEYINQKWPEDGPATKRVRVALISTAKMKALRVLFDRHRTLVTSVGGEVGSPTIAVGNELVWDALHLAYGWIPASCIVWTITLAEFRQICRDRNIQPDDATGHDPFELLDAPGGPVTSLEQQVEDMSI